MKRSLLLAFAAPLMLAGAVHGASDYFLEIDGIKGESQSVNYPESIEIQWFSWGASNTGVGSTGGGIVEFTDFEFSTKVGKATPQLMLSCATGNSHTKATLHVRKVGQTSEEYYKIIMTDVLVRSVHQTGRIPDSPDTDSTPVDKVVLYFDAVTIEHTGDDGTVTTGRASRTSEQP